MKKVFLGCLASLMVAGAISAASGVTITHSAKESIVMIGDGTSPIPIPADAAGDSCDVSSQIK